ncbi:hypothetical protein [Mucilaginibacter sp.]
METIIVKISVKKTDELAEHLREQGLFFTAIAQILEIDSTQIEEIQEDEYHSLKYD